MSFYLQKERAIDAEIVRLTQEQVKNDYSRGAVALLHHLKLKVMKAIDDCNSRFAAIHTSKIVETLQDDEASSSSESESDFSDA